MLKVLIVEDEKAARERLESMGIWSSGEYSLCGSAHNGKDGLRIYYTAHPEIIITDIEMPVMDGLDFIAEVRKEDPDIPIIILSCYESFSYAQKSIQLGVQDYLIKDFLEPEVLRSALVRAAGKRYSDILKVNRKSRFRTEMVSDLFSFLKNNTTDALKKIKPGFSDKQIFSLLLIQIDSFNHETTDINTVIVNVEKGLQSESDSIISYRGDGLIAALLGMEEEKPVFDISARIIDFVEYRCNISLTIAAADSFTNLSDIQGVYSATKDLLTYRIFLGQRRVITPAHIRNVTWMDPETTEHSLRILKQAVMQNNSNTFFKTLENLFQVEISGMIQYNYIEYVNISLLSLLLTYIDTHHLRLSDKFSIDILNLHTVHALETISDIYRWFKKQFTEVFSLTQGKRTAEIRSYHIREIISAIQSGYSGDLTLETLAEKAGLHKVYLSRLFKKETGRTCYEYIQDVRIRNAKEMLLYTSLTIAEIAKQTGFKSYDQFAVVFKKLTGDTPTLYRGKYK